MVSEEEFLAEMERVKHRHKEELEKLGRDFAASRKIAKVGDRVSNGSRTLTVTSILWGYHWRFDQIPRCGYKGKVLTNKMLPRRDGEVSIIWQEGVVSVNGVEVVHD